MVYNVGMRKSAYLKIFVGLGVVIVAISAVVLVMKSGNFYKTQTERSDELIKVSVQLKWQHQAQFAGMYAAKELDIYKKHGLDVTFRRGGTDFPSILAVLAEGFDFGVAGADDVLVAISEEKPVRAVAVIYQDSPVVYFSLKESGIETPEDFIGKRVGVREGTGTYFTYVAMMNNLGIDRANVEEVAATTFGISPLLEGEVDVWPGFRTNEPLVAEQMGYEVNIVKPEEFGVDIYADVLIASNETIEQSPDVVDAFVKATLEGWEWALANRSEATDITMKYAEGTTKEHQRAMLDASAPLIKPSEGMMVGQMNFSKWNQTYGLLKQFDVITKDIDVSDAYVRSFIK